MCHQKTNGLPDISIQSVLDKAHSLLGVPYHHQGRSDKHGLDCVGLILAAYKPLNREFDIPADYSSVPRPKTLLTTLQKYCDEVTDMKVGDILVMVPRRQPQHVALYVGDNCIIHSYGEAGKVVKHELTAQYKIHSIYRLK